MKERIDVGVYQYPHTPEGLQEALHDAYVQANELHKAANRYLSKQWVLEDTEYYYGPVSEHKRQGLVYNQIATAHIIVPGESEPTTIPEEVIQLLDQYNQLDKMLSDARLRLDVSDREYNACEAAPDKMKAIEEELKEQGYSLFHAVGIGYRLTAILPEGT